MKEQARLKEIEQILNTPFCMTVKLTLKQQCKKKLKEIAGAIIARTPGIPNLDRVAQRQRPALILWFCEHWHIAQGYFQGHIELTDRSELQPARQPELSSSSLEFGDEIEFDGWNSDWDYDFTDDQN
jgi:hypothetical protein